MKSYYSLTEPLELNYVDDWYTFPLEEVKDGKERQGKRVPLHFEKMGTYLMTCNFELLHKAKSDSLAWGLSFFHHGHKPSFENKTDVQHPFGISESRLHIFEPGTNLELCIKSYQEQTFLRMSLIITYIS